MDPITMSLITRGVMGAGQTLGALINKPGARPIMQTPDSIEELERRASSVANASTDNIQLNQNQIIDNSASNAVNNVKRTAGNSSDLIGAITQIQGNTNRAKMNASNEFASRKIGYENNLNRALQIKGQYEQQNQNYNKIAPYEEAVTANNQLMQAGLGNISDAADMTSTYGAITGKNFSDMFGKKPKLHETNPSYIPGVEY